MAEDKKQQLEQQLWKIADTLRGKMDADDFRDYILGFIFYKYLSEKMHDYATHILKPDNITYDQLKNRKDKKALLAAVKDSVKLPGGETPKASLSLYWMTSPKFSRTLSRAPWARPAKKSLATSSKTLTSPAASWAKVRTTKMS
jgi:hypothetical protein